MKHLYLEKLKRMNTEKLLEECGRHGKVLENEHPMTPEQRSRAYMCFKYTHARAELDDDTKRMLETAIRVLRLLQG